MSVYVLFKAQLQEVDGEWKIISEVHPVSFQREIDAKGAAIRLGPGWDIIETSLAKHGGAFT